MPCQVDKGVRERLSTSRSITALASLGRDLQGFAKGLDDLLLREVAAAGPGQEGAATRAEVGGTAGEGGGTGWCLA